MKHEYISAKQAAEELGISLASLYAYVSRGLIQSVELDRRKRTKSYSVEDVRLLKQKKEHRRDPARAVERSLDWGTPVLESSLSLIEDHRLCYRGYDAIELARKVRPEQVAALIWNDELPTENKVSWFDDAPELPSSVFTVRESLPELAPIEAFQALLPLAAASDPAAYNLRPEWVMQTGANIILLMTAIASKTTTVGGMAETLAEAWCPGDEGVAPMLASALILCADHGLNASSFTARCVASARANPYQVVLAGLAALQGAKHGRETERFAAFLREIGTPDRVTQVVNERLRHDVSIPSCGHPLYPDGDPRGELLIDMARDFRPDHPVVTLVDEIDRVADELVGERPGLDAGLVTLSEALELPEGSPLTLFALGRSIGWIGQALEAYEGKMIRPRAKYVGEQPRPLPL